jgi:hypothetical protein
MLQCEFENSIKQRQETFDLILQKRLQSWTYLYLLPTKHRLPLTEPFQNVNRTDQMNSYFGRLKSPSKKIEDLNGCWSKAEELQMPVKNLRDPLIF